MEVLAESKGNSKSMIKEEISVILYNKLLKLRTVVSVFLEYVSRFFLFLLHVGFVYYFVQSLQNTDKAQARNIGNGCFLEIQDSGNRSPLNILLSIVYTL